MIEKIRKYNNWDGETGGLGYIRSSYTAELMRYAGNRLVKVLVGQRRSGKSYILRQLAHSFITKQGVVPTATLFINTEFFDSTMPRDISTLEEIYGAYRKEIAPIGKVYIFIDEVQNIEGWEIFVNARSQDFTDDCELFITGSNSQLLAGELATLLSGRYVKFEVYPYSFSEYCDVSGVELSRQSYRNYLHTGGMPELVNLPAEDMRCNYMASLRDTIMLRDIVARYKVKDVTLLTDIFAFLVNNASSIVSIKNIVNFLGSQKRKTNYETVSTYIGYLEHTFLIHKVPRYNIRGKEIISGNAKYYVNDLAFHNYLYRGFGYGEGYLLENAIYIELRRKGYDVYTGSNAEKEVDFIAIKGDETLYVQVSLELNSESTIEREYSSLLSITDHHRKVVVSLDDFPLPSNNGIVNLPAWKW